jgi:hypothetical protein
VIYLSWQCRRHIWGSHCDIWWNGDRGSIFCFYLALQLLINSL